MLRSCVLTAAFVSCASLALAVDEPQPDADAVVQDSQVMTFSSGLNPEADETVVQQLTDVITVGSALFNDGDHQGCADAYAAATKAIDEQALRPWHRVQVVTALQSAPDGATEQAWHYRRLFDGVLADLTFKPVREAKLPVGFPEHGPVGIIVAKEYPSYRMAMSAGGAAFGRLFMHIQRRGIPMTAPVEMARTDDGSFMMGFLYENMEQGNAGEQDNITVVDIGERSVLSMTLRGDRTAAAYKQAQELIQNYAKQENIAISDDWRVFGYSSPMIPRDRRYYEVQVTLKTDANQAPRQERVEDF